MSALGIIVVGIVIGAVVGGMLLLAYINPFKYL